MKSLKIQLAIMLIESIEKKTTTVSVKNFGSLFKIIK